MRELFQIGVRSSSRRKFHAFITLQFSLKLQYTNCQTCFSVYKVASQNRLVQTKKIRSITNHLYPLNKNILFNLHRLRSLVIETPGLCYLYNSKLIDLIGNDRAVYRVKSLISALTTVRPPRFAFSHMFIFLKNQQIEELLALPDYQMHPWRLVQHTPAHRAAIEVKRLALEAQ